jgi:hypothetical protein
MGEAGAAVAVLALLVGLALCARNWSRRPERRVWTLLAGALLLSLVAAGIIVGSPHAPVGAVGWPLLWMVPLTPLRIVHATGQDPAFAVGLLLSLAANALTVGAAAYAGLYATGRRAVGLGAATLFATFPVWMWLLEGGKGWENSTWNVDAGLHMVTEPLSTALVATGAALLLSPSLTPMRLGLAGLTLGYAVTVRPTNGFLAVVAVALVAARVGWRRTLPYLAGGLCSLPILLAFMRRKTGYEFSVTTSAHGPLYSGSYVGHNWADSLLFGPQALLILVPLAMLGVWLLRNAWTRLLFAAWIVPNALFYSFFRATVEHPRYLFMSLPAVLVLWSAGLALIASSLRRLRTT